MGIDERVVCEVRYCPGCGTEIFCNVLSTNDLIFYPSEEMARNIEMCQNCGRDFTGLSLGDLEKMSDRRETESTRRRTTAGKNDMVEAIAKAKPEEFLSKAAAERGLNAVRDALIEIVSAGKNIRWAGVGTFKIKQHKARRARHPRTGEMIDVPAKKAITFVPAKNLKKIIEELPR